jgi:two-component system cell cycle response regulator DivK
MLTPMTLAIRRHVCRFPRVLIADPSADIRDLYVDVLEGMVDEFVHAEDGRDALVKAMADVPSALITDTQLPFINGYELCRLLRRDMATRTLPILMITGRAVPAELQVARAAGADIVLTKPCLPETLQAEMERLAIRTETWRDPSGAAPGGPEQAPEVALAGSGARRKLSKLHARRETTNPPLVPPPLRCPTCDRPLAYQRSHIGGVTANESEQWDYYACERGCGNFQYRQRTRRLRYV